MENLPTLINQNAEPNILYVVQKEDLLQFADIIIQNTVNQVQQAIQELNKPDELLTREQVRDYLGTSYPTLHRRKEDGKLIPLKVGGSVMYRRSDVEAFILREKKVKSI